MFYQTGVIQCATMIHSDSKWLFILHLSHITFKISLLQQNVTNKFCHIFCHQNCVTWHISQNAIFWPLGPSKRGHIVLIHHYILQYYNSLYTKCIIHCIMYIPTTTEQIWCFRPFGPKTPSKYHIYMAPPTRRATRGFGGFPPNFEKK